jgi:hypothetical protein
MAESDVNIAYECMMAARGYSAQLRDMQRHMADAGEGAMSDELRKRMMLGIIILAERIGAQRVCGLSDAVASTQVVRMNEALDALHTGDTDKFRRSLDSLI